MEQASPLQPRAPLQLRGVRRGFGLSPFEWAVLAAAFAVAAFGGYTIYAEATDLNAKPPAAASTYIPAFRTNISSTISTTGTVQATQQVNLNFGSSGVIKEINVKVGDQVTAGQVLARLDDAQLQSALRAAQSNLASAQARLNAVINPSAADLASAQQAVLNAQNQVATAQKNLDDLRAKPTAADIASAQQAVLQAQNALQSAQDALAKAQADLARAQRDLSSARSDLSNAYDTLSLARSDLRTAETACPDAPPTPSLPAKGSRAQPAPFVSVTVDCDGNAAALAAYKAANAAYGSAAGAYNAAVTNADAKQSALESAQATLSSGNLERAIQSAQLGLQTALQKQQETLAGATPIEIQAAENSLSAAQASLTAAQQRYEELLHPAPDAVLPLQASVAQAAEAVDAAQANLDKATIVAPFDGVIAAINGTVGGQATGGATTTAQASAAVVSLLNPRQIRIDANVDQADVSKLRTGQPASITFDALAGFVYQASVSSVGLLPTTSQGVVTYLVSFAIDTGALPPTTPVPTPGMTAQITVTVGSAQNALVVPTRSVRGSGNLATVTV
ncbi:MAG TPA: HlyD family efflux transporter periplasmic adaptor subunit, partial [Dehalococcoidia bacterium]|nr:HlyD family efflux transporter periplasmic adaptor subunit [Dehalococcoidia bacterium]